MNKTAVKAFFVIIETILAVIIIGISGYALVHMDSTNDLYFRFAATGVRMLVIYIFALYYFFDLSDTYGSLELFMPLYILFATISELKVFQYFSVFGSLVIIPPQAGVFLLVLSTLMITSCLTGYEVFYNHNTAVSSKTFIQTAFLACIILSMILPKPQSIELVRYTPHLFTLCLLLFSVTVLTSLIQLISNNSASEHIKHIGIAVLMVSHYLLIFHTSRDMEIIASAVFTITSLGLAVILKLKEENL